MIRAGTTRTVYAFSRIVQSGKTSIESTNGTFYGTGSQCIRFFKFELFLFNANMIPQYMNSNKFSYTRAGLIIFNLGVLIS